jgi:hypothetical protein
MKNTKIYICTCAHTALILEELTTLEMPISI